MAKILTQIEKLDGRYPGLAFKVKHWFDQGRTSAEVRQLLQDQLGVSVTKNMVEGFRRKRWTREKNSVALKAETIKAAVEAFGGDAGLDALASAKIWELMDKMTLPQLFAAKQLFVKIRAQDLKEQEFLFKTGQLPAARRSDGQEGAEGQEAAADAETARVVQRIKEIFGIGSGAEQQPASPDVPATASKESE
jgi:hypothetical protein